MVDQSLGDLGSPEIGLPILQIERVLLAEKVTRSSKRIFRAASLPGIILHYIIEGEVTQECGGVKQRITPGKAVWYDSEQIIRGEILQAPWSFYTICFSCPNLPSIPVDQKVVDVPPAMEQKFEEFLLLFRRLSREGEPSVRENLDLSCQLLQIIAHCYPVARAGGEPQRGMRDWWQIENDYIREIHQAPPLLEQLALRYRLSTKAIRKLCKEATSMTPMQRLKRVRMMHVRGLLIASDMQISEVAYATGYSRVQDLSRDCKRCFNLTPSQLRSQTTEELPDAMF